MFSILDTILKFSISPFRQQLPQPDSCPSSKCARLFPRDHIFFALRKRAVPRELPTVEAQDFAAYASFCRRELDFFRQRSIDRSRHRRAKAARLLPVTRARGLSRHLSRATEQCRRKETRRDRPMLASL